MDTTTPDWQARARTLDNDCRSVLFELELRSALLPHRYDVPRDPLRRLIAECIIYARTMDDTKRYLPWETRVVQVLGRLKPLLRTLLDVPGPDHQKARLEHTVRTFWNDAHLTLSRRRAQVGLPKAVRRGTQTTSIQRQALYLYGIYHLFAHPSVRPAKFFSHYLPEMLKLSFPNRRFAGASALRQQIKLAGGLSEAVHHIACEIAPHPRYAELKAFLKSEPVRFFRSPKSVRAVLVYVPGELESPDVDQLIEHAWAEYGRKQRERTRPE